MDLGVTKGNIWVSIWQMSWPMVVMMLGNFTLGIVDIYAAGRLGPEAQASVGFCMQIFFFLSIVANAISIGTLSLVSRFAGAGNRLRTLEVARQAILCGFGLSIVILLVLRLSVATIVESAGLPKEVRELSVSLLEVYSLALAGSYIVIIASAIFRANGEPLKALFIMLSMNVVNIGLIFPLVFGIGTFEGLGAKGLAVAMVASTFCGLLLSLSGFADKGWEGFYKGRVYFDKEDFLRIASIGWPTAIMQIAWYSGTLALMGILGRLEGVGVAALAAMTNGLRIEAIIYLPAFALNMAASALIGQNLGADNASRAEKTGWLIALAGVCIVSVLSLIIFFIAPFIASKISMDAEVQRETVIYLYFNLPIEPLMALGVILAGAMQGAGDTKGVMKIILFCMWGIRIPLAWMLAMQAGWGQRGVWTAMVVSMFLQGSLMAYRFKGGRWKTL